MAGNINATGLGDTELHTGPLPIQPDDTLAQLPAYLHQMLSLTPQKLAVITMHTCVGKYRVFYLAGKLIG